MLKDINFKHINKNSTQEDCIFVTFASWSDKTSVFFGENFLQKKGVETFLISQKEKNHWWHTEEMYEVAKIVRERSGDKKVILYGSSMGGYAAIHYRNLFNADIAIAIAPQIFIDKNIAVYENRWEKDLSVLQNKLLFNEIQNVNNQKGTLYILYDCLHPLDNEHTKQFSRVYESNRSDINLIKVPYASHDLARFLHNAGMLKKIVEEIQNTGVLEADTIGRLNTLYLEDCKTFFNYFRTIKELEVYSDSEKSRLLDKMEKYLEELENMDFEALYMAAESLSNVGLHEKAISLSRKSIDSYKDKYLRDAPTYLYKKHENIIKKSKLV